MIQVGQKVEFDPFEYLTGYGVEDIRGETVTGTVDYVNYEHRWFSVVFENSRHSFKFHDIGEVVTICG